MPGLRSRISAEQLRDSLDTCGQVGGIGVGPVQLLEDGAPLGFSMDGRCANWQEMATLASPVLVQCASRHASSTAMIAGLYSVCSAYEETAWPKRHHWPDTATRAVIVGSTVAPLCGARGQPLQYLSL